uniref:Uncharacterized protein n=1 Tax=Lygus hesperus TaxID=30085 RepID=A0A0A9ZG59_LYGHE
MLEIVDEYMVATPAKDQTHLQQLLLVSDFFSKIYDTATVAGSSAINDQHTSEVLVSMERIGFVVPSDTTTTQPEECENKEWYVRSLQHPKYIERRKRIYDTVTQLDLQL